MVNVSKVRVQAMSRHNVRANESARLHVKSNGLMTVVPTPIMGNLFATPSDALAKCGQGFSRLVRGRHAMQWELYT